MTIISTGIPSYPHYATYETTRYTHYDVLFMYRPIYIFLMSHLHGAVSNHIGYVLVCTPTSLHTHLVAHHAVKPH